MIAAIVEMIAVFLMSFLVIFKPCHISNVDTITIITAPRTGIPA